jgi:hypothetical protein
MRKGIGEKDGNRDGIEGSKKGLKRRSTEIGTGGKKDRKRTGKDLKEGQEKGFERMTGIGI